MLTVVHMGNNLYPSNSKYSLCMHPGPHVNINHHDFANEANVIASWYTCISIHICIICKLANYIFINFETSYLRCPNDLTLMILNPNPQESIRIWFIFGKNINRKAPLLIICQFRQIRSRDQQKYIFWMWQFKWSSNVSSLIPTW